jgi:hypothetical protein
MSANSSYNKEIKALSDLVLQRKHDLKIDSIQEVINVDKDGNETKIENYEPSNKYEFRGKDYFYLLDAAKHVCTHHKNMLTVGNAYVEATLSVRKFLDITIGDFKYQRKSLLDEIRNVKEKQCDIKTNHGTVLKRIHAFILVFEETDANELPSHDMIRYKNIGRNKTEKVHIMMAKPLVEGYLLDRNHGEKTEQYYKHPPRLFATIIDAIKRLLKEMETWTKTSQYRPDIINYAELLDNPSALEGYVRFFEYFLRAGAWQPTKKDISINKYDLVKTCVPHLTQIDRNRKVRFRDEKKVFDFLRAAVILGQQIKGYDFNIDGPMDTDTSDFGRRDYLRCKISHPNADKPNGTNC